MLERDNYTNIGKNLKDLRQERNFSRNDVAQHLKIKETYIQAIENGKIENIPFKVHLHGYLKSYSDFLGGCNMNLTGLLRADNENLNLQPQNILLDKDLKPSALILYLSLGILSLLYIIYGNF